MATNFFRGLEHLYPDGEWMVSVRAAGKGCKIVSVLPMSANVKDDAAKNIPPMTLKGTAQELDEGFFNAIQKPVEKTVALFTNLIDYEKALETAKAQSKIESDKKDRAKKEAGEKNSRYQSQMKKVDELETAGKLGEAIGQLPKPADFPEQAEAIKTREAELRRKHGGLSLFDENQ